MPVKNIIRSVLIFFHIDLTKNLEYDRLTKLIMKKLIKSNSNCIDVGCHKGEILEDILKLAPQGKHVAFEPIPYLFENLKLQFSGKAIIYPYALAETEGKSTFQLVANAPAYSGIKKRKYDIENPEIQEIEVELKTLDSLIPQETAVNFIKIDVEGAEYGVLKGAKNILNRDKPFVVFEFGLGASDFYGTKPEEMYHFFKNETGLKISTLKSFAHAKPSLTLAEFEKLYSSNKEYYFIAHQ